MKQIPNYPFHSISEDGLTIINTLGRTLKLSPQLIKGKPTGYIYASMFAPDYSYRKFVAVHRLVAFTYLEPPISDKHIWINHKDGNKGNNHFSNLEWTTISQNIKHSFDVLGRITPKGVEHWNSGTKASISTKQKMSAKKTGVNHPKFKGYYVVNGKLFDSAIAAGKHVGKPNKTIINWCKAKKNGCYFLPVNK